MKACLTPAKSQRRSVTLKHHHASPYQSTGEVKGSPSNEQARQPKPKPNSTTAAQAKDPKATASMRETAQAASANKNEQTGPTTQTEAQLYHSSSGQRPKSHGEQSGNDPGGKREQERTGTNTNEQKHQGAETQERKEHQGS